MSTGHIPRAPSAHEELHTTRVLLAMALERLGGSLVISELAFAKKVAEGSLTLKAESIIGGGFHIRVEKYVRPPGAIPGVDYPRGDE